jgi:hypothetical protein
MVILELILKERKVQGINLARCSEDANEPSGCKRGGEFVDYLKNRNVLYLGTGTRGTR